MSIEAMKQALEALEGLSEPYYVLKAQDALRTAIEQAEKPNEDYERGFVDGMQEQMKSSVDRAVNAMCKRGKEPYDQTALELCKECGWKAIIPGDGCLVCARQKAKPVAYVDQRIHGWPDCFVMEPDPPHTVPLYTEPREWVELTDDEARALVNRATFGDRTNWQALVYMVDAKLKEKNDVLRSV